MDSLRLEPNLEYDAVIQNFGDVVILWQKILGTDDLIHKQELIKYTDRYSLISLEIFKDLSPEHAEQLRKMVHGR